MPRVSGFAAAIAAAALLAACASGGEGGGGGGLGGLFRPDPNAGVTVVDTQKNDNSFFLKSGFCPPVQILPGTESMALYERGHEGDAAFVRVQGSITRTARECHTIDAETLSIKLGVAGRILAGPKGSAGAVKMPIRVAVARQHDNSVIYSQAFSVAATLSAPDYAADYSEVFDQVTFKVKPDDRDLIVYVGFDEGAQKGKTGT